MWVRRHWWSFEQKEWIKKSDEEIAAQKAAKEAGKSKKEKEKARE